jgi:coenzyme F420-reducing hydrogenase beta subunit/polysaccharide pyruvyl transferase WcaK-like protein
MEKRTRLQLGIVAATFTGNRGAEAMMLATIAEIRRAYPDADIHVMSYSPKADLAWLQDHYLPRVYLHSSTPATLALRWLPMALLCRLLPFLRRPLRCEHGQSIGRLLDLHVVVDLAGVSFVDGREKFLPFNVLTLYPFLLHGVPVAKLSQALGPMCGSVNRLFARWVLARVRLLVARGSHTARNLAELGIDSARIEVLPDTSFCLRVESPPASFVDRDGVVVMPSSLVARQNDGYLRLLKDTIALLLQQGYTVALLAHSWKEATGQGFNNDLPLCRELYRQLGSPSTVRILGPGLNARDLKQAISCYRLAIASRFHGMIAALDTETPTLVLGWGHKYDEVLLDFGLEHCALDASGLTPDSFAATIAEAHASSTATSRRIADRLPAIRRQSVRQFELLFALIAQTHGLHKAPAAVNRLIEPDTATPLGTYHKAWIGYSADASIREEAASGGIVSAVLIHLLETDQIDAALVCHSELRNGELNHRMFLARTRDEVLSARTSKYYDIPILRGLKLIDDFDGRVAVVGLPSQINAIAHRMAANPIFERKVVLRISLFCGHNSKDELIRYVWKKKGINEADIVRFVFRKGLWRGRMHVDLKDGSTREFPFQDFSLYQNLHILSLDRCLNCFDHTGYYADLSTGDVWMKHVRGWDVKPSVFLARSERAVAIIEQMAAAGKLVARETNRETVYRAQMRSINYHYGVAARARLGSFFRLNIRDRTNAGVRPRDLLAGAIVLFNHRISRSPRALKVFMAMPRPLVTLYLYLFKGLMHYRRKTL